MELYQIPSQCTSVFFLFVAVLVFRYFLLSFFLTDIYIYIYIHTHNTMLTGNQVIIVHTHTRTMLTSKHGKLHYRRVSPVHKTCTQQLFVLSAVGCFVSNNVPPSSSLPIAIQVQLQALCNRYVRICRQYELNPCSCNWILLLCQV